MLTEAAPGLPVVDTGAVPAVTAAEMAQVDRLAMEEFGIGLDQMVEQAGSHLAEVVRVELGGSLVARTVVVAAGPGHNGAGGLAAARHLANRGARVGVLLSRPVARLPEASRRQLATLLEMGMDCCVAGHDRSDAELGATLAGADVVADAVLGYRGRGLPRADEAALIGRVAESGAPVVSLDLPSGLDAATGLAAGPAVRAQATMTVALPKTAMLGPAGRDLAGRLYLADIGLPAALYGRLDLEVGAIFAAGRIVRLADGVSP